MSWAEKVPAPEFPSVPPRPRYHSPAARSMLRHANAAFGWGRKDLEGPSEEGLQRARNARWGLDGMSDPGLMK